MSKVRRNTRQDNTTTAPVTKWEQRKQRGLRKQRTETLERIRRQESFELGDW